MVYDVTRSDSLRDCVQWKADIDSKVLTPVTRKLIPTLLVGNKCDLFEVESPDEEFCRKHGFCGVFKVSAKANINIEECMNVLAQKCKENYDEILECMSTDQTEVPFRANTPSKIPIVSYPYNQVNSTSTAGCCVQ